MLIKSKNVKNNYLFFLIINNYQLFVNIEPYKISMVNHAFYKYFLFLLYNIHTAFLHSEQKFVAL
ncbi:hypothetical protein BpHYR1_046675 [Brachionus plicatilis]|uniref:Uncharacterized protein n=1 Tax=Brachionus plicatilis TaxID=10195 RepID=A0A3M7RVP6_BRAPC|nr:hypothetical protein BpHYR1_046675 [Brachionus plicatilis]